MRHKKGSTVYIVISNTHVAAATVKYFRGGYYTVQIADKPGALHLRESRLFPTVEAAYETLPETYRPKPKSESNAPRYNPLNYL